MQAEKVGVIDGFVGGVAKTFQNKFVILFLALGILVALIVISVLIIRRVLSSSLTVGRVFKDIISGSAAAVKVKASGIPDLVNGSQFAYSFWLYVQSAPGQSAPRMVLSHPFGDDAGFKVLLSKDTNTLTCQFGRANPADPVTGAPALQNTASIKYLPMNRWVHVVVVYNNGTVTFFEDGEVHSVHGLQQQFDGKSGEMSISGGIDEDPLKYGPFKGFVGHVAVMNFQPSPGLVKRLYAQGPTARQGWLSVFGIPGYGVRNPVYKLNTVKNSDESALL